MARRSPRLLISIFLALVLLATAATSPTAHAAAIRPPLSTKGSRIVDATGRTAVLQGVNWFGFETSSHVVHGLWSRDLADVMTQIRQLGFNTIRLPFSLQGLDATSLTGVDFSGGRNAALRDATPLQALDAVIAEAGRQGLLVLLDCHSLGDDGYSYGLWYGQAGYDEDDWVAAWRRLARRYRTSPNVIGADLKNEPHGPATWGTGGRTDWRRAAQRAGNAILSVAPNWLIVVGGVEGPVPGQRLTTHWWGGNLEGVAKAPVRLSRPGRLVYSPHEYGPGVFRQPWFSSPRVASILERRWRTGFGYVADRGIAPVLVGEFGGREVRRDTVEGRWQRQFLDFLGRESLSWTYWSLNPNSGDTGGILEDDWTTVNAAKMDLLRRLMRRQRIDFRPRPAGGRVKRRRPADTTTTPAPAAAPAAPAAPSTGTPRAIVVVDSRWDAGWCGHLEISGGGDADLSSRTIALTLPHGAAVTQSWNGTFSATTGAIRIALPGWARVRDGGPYRDTGLCASGAGAPTGVSVA